MNPPADAAQTTQTLVTNPAWLPAPGNWPAQGDLLTWCDAMGPGMATLLVVLGIIYLAFGIYMFRALITFNAIVLGAWIGTWLGGKLGGAVPGAVIGAFVAAALAWPMMKWAVALMGGIYGAVLGAAIWRSVGLDDAFAWAGAGMGTIGFGMLSFILFRGSIMMYTSLQGAVMLVFGVLGLLLEYQRIAPMLLDGMASHRFVLPMAIFIPAVVGLIFQQAQYSEAPAAGQKK